MDISDWPIVVRLRVIILSRLIFISVGWYHRMHMLAVMYVMWGRKKRGKWRFRGSRLSAWPQVPIYQRQPTHCVNYTRLPLESTVLDSCELNARLPLKTSSHLFEYRIGGKWGSRSIMEKLELALSALDICELGKIECRTVLGFKSRFSLLYDQKGLQDVFHLGVMPCEVRNNLFSLLIAPLRLPCWKDRAVVCCTRTKRPVVYFELVVECRLTFRRNNEWKRKSVAREEGK